MVIGVKLEVSKSEAVQVDERVDDIVRCVLIKHTLLAWNDPLVVADVYDVSEGADDHEIDEHEVDDISERLTN